MLYEVITIDPQKFLRSVNRLLFNQSLSQDHERLSLENHRLNSILSVYHKCMAFLATTELEHLNDQIVITSYSIHYTKLYELPGLARRSIR